MAALVKLLGETIHAFELMFFRALIGFLVFAPWLLVRDGFSVIRTTRPGLHAWRGFVGACGNFCFFYAITHMVLADAMALQFSRPLFMIVLAFLFLGEVAGKRRSGIALVGFVGILVMLRPFGGGFDPDGLVAASGALFGGLVVIAIKKLAATEPTRRIVFYYAFYTTLFSAPAAAMVWVWPSVPELAILVLVGCLGIAGQALVTHGFAAGEATITVPFDYMRIVYSAVIGFVFFAEAPTAWSVAGATLIIGSNLLLLRPERK